MTAKIFYGHNFLAKAELITRAYHSHTDQAEITVAVALKQLCVNGYHVYKDVWAAVVSEELVWRKRKFSRHVCCISNESVIVGHLPRKISPVTSLFFIKDGTILC